MTDNASSWDAVLLVDIGDLFAARDVVSDVERELHLDRARAYLEIFGAMGHDAQGIGDRDLALGVETLQRLAKEAKFPFLNANIRGATSDEPLFRERIVLERAGVRIGMFGLLSPNFPRAEQVQRSENITIADPETVARAQVEALRREGAQVIVVLAHLPLEECRALGERVPGITALLGSASQQLLRHPESAGDAFVTDSFTKGKYVSVLSLLIDEASRGEGNEGLLRFVDPNQRQTLVDAVQQAKIRLQSRERALEQAREASKDAPGDEARPGRARNVEWLESSMKELQTEVETLERELAALPEGEPEGRHFIAFDSHAMAKHLADDPEILAKTEALKEKHPKLKVAGH